MMDDSLREFIEAKKVTSRLERLLFVWRTAWALAALLDFLATVLPGLLRAKGGLDEDGILHENMIWHEYEFLDHPVPDFPFGIILKWLNRNCGRIGFAFSLFWFLEAFVDARRSRDRALLESDRKRLLKWNLQDDDEQDAIAEEMGYLDDNLDSFVAYYLELLWQLMLLPVGFYLLLSQWMYAVSLWDGDDRGLLGTMLRETYDVEELTGSFTVTRDKNLALGVALLNKLLHMIFNFLEQQGIVVTHLLLQEAFQLVRIIIGRAILHPRRFARRTKKVLTTIRWIKYLQPILSTSNKLRGNLADLSKRHRQRQAFLKEQKTRRDILNLMMPEERKEYAAKTIQSLWRAYQSRRSLRAMKILLGQREMLAAIKMQAVFRKKLSEARVRIKRKQFELAKLKAKSEMDMMWKSTLKKETKRMTPQERLRLYELEEEFQKESVKLLGQRMLLKPNSTFAITWKILFCACVVFEITGLVVNPFLKQQTDEITGAPLTVDKAFKKLLIPELDECTCSEPELKGWRANLLGRIHRNRKPKQTCDASLFPWYCEPPYSTARSFYKSVMEFLIDKFLVIVGLVCFLDVPVNFFTGKFDASGCLVPKPFFNRWILPGLVLQLLVNPQMASTSELVGTLLNHVGEIGPVRVWRWTLAFFYPLFLAMFDFSEKLWMHLVDKENHETVVSQAKTRVLSRRLDEKDKEAANSISKVERPE